jgi:hypothetical protein
LLRALVLIKLPRLSYEEVCESQLHKVIVSLGSCALSNVCCLPKLLSLPPSSSTTSVVLIHVRNFRID